MKDDWKGLNLAELIDLLEPVPQPPPVSMVPQTAGWLWLGAILLVIIGVGCWKFLRWHRKTAYRRAALAELATCPNDPQRIAELLRRTALSAYERKDVAALHGTDWLEFLDHAYGGTGFSNGPGKAVAEAPYKKNRRWRRSETLDPDLDQNAQGCGDMIEFAHPYAFFLLPLPLAVYVLVPPHQERVSALRFPFFRRLAEVAGQAPKAGSVIFRRTTLQNLAAIAIWGLLVTALAAPERVGEPIIQEKAARDVMLAIDISGSMDQVDFISQDGERTQRLDAVKRVVGDFISARDGDRVALIVFGAKAFVQAPFTEDLASVRALLEQTEVGMAGPHTVLGDAIGLSIKTFQASQIEDRLLILLSDGADTGSRMTPVNAAAIAAREGIEIISIGVGDPEGSSDQRLDERTLKSISGAADGTYFFAGDENGLAEIYTRIDAQKPRAVETRSFRPREPLGHMLLILAALIGIGALAILHAQKARRRTA